MAGRNAETAADQAARQRAREDFEAQQRQILNKANVAHLNANTFTLWQDAINRGLDHDPERATYKSIYDAASDPDSGLETRIVTDTEAQAMREADSHTLAKHVFLPLGMKPVFENGEVVRNADGSPKEVGQIAVITANDNGKFTVPQKMVDDVHKYAKAAGILNEDSLKAGDEMEFNRFARLYGEIQAAKKQAAGAKPELVTVADENATEGEGFGVAKGRKLQRRNPISGDLSDPDATELQNYRKGQADLNNRQDKGSVTDRDRFVQDREDNRIRLKAVADGTSTVADRAVIAERLRKGGLDPSQLSKRGKDYNAVLAEADRQEMEETGQHFNFAQAQTDYKYANTARTKDTLNMIDGMTEAGGAIDIAKKAASKLPQMNSKTANKVFNIAKTEFGDNALSDFHTAMLGLADEYSKVMGGGVSSDTGRQQALDILNAAYSKGQMAGAIQIMQSDIAARKRAIIGKNRYLLQEYGDSTGQATAQNPQSGQTQTVQPQAAQNLPPVPQGMIRIQDSQGGFHNIPKDKLQAAQQRDPNLKVIQ